MIVLCSCSGFFSALFLVILLTATLLNVVMSRIVSEAITFQLWSVI